MKQLILVLLMTTISDLKRPTITAINNLSNWNTHAQSQ